MKSEALLIFTDMCYPFHHLKWIKNLVGSWVYKIKSHVVNVIRTWVDIRNIHNSKLAFEVFDINCHLSIPPCQVMQNGNSYNWEIFRFKCGCIHTGYKQGNLQRELKVTHKDFAILNSHKTVIYLLFIKIPNFFVAKQKNLK